MRKLYKGIFSKGGYLFMLGILLTVASCNKPRFDVIGDLDQNNPSAKHRKVLIIGISGVRGDAIMKANVPNINQMLNNSIYSFDALTEAPTLEAPGWSSMLTGAWSAKHGVVTNSYTGNKFDKYPMFFKRIKEFNPDLKTIAISSTTSINTNLVSNADVLNSFEKDDISVKNSAVTALTDTTSDVVFVNFNSVNTAGTQYGFDPSIPEYMQAIAAADGYVGELTAAIDARASIKNEDWLVIISTDHGGTLTGTGGNEYESRNIFTVFYNKKFNKNNIAKSQTNTTFVKFLNASGQYAYSDSSFYSYDKWRRFTVECRIKVDGTLSSDPAILGNKDWNSGTRPGWVVFVNGQSWGFNAGDGTRRIDPKLTTPVLSDGKWHHIAVTVNRNSTVKLYQDGVFLLNSATITTLTTLDNTLKGKFAVANEGSLNYSKTLKVNMADIRIWNEALDDATIKTFAKCDTTITPDHPFYDNLMGWWKGNDGKGTIMKDYSLRNINLKMAGTPKWEETGKNLCGDVIQADVPKAVDIATQVYSWLKIPIKPEWNLDGKPWVNN
ncbi:alkaline phosphatase family protein [Pedobacter frigoris]|uniref:alkaline phosphatase family protein n=1 Tax=Pedobacter frigoris TaxID=2571272 RepID=UPI00292F9775|nr:alkaline phosphatase family protein [Pedobacter frigoris]